MSLTRTIALTAITPPTPSPAPAHGGGDGTGLWLLLALAALIYGVGYAISIRLHPYKACPRCGGSGKHRGTWFSDSFRACDRCGGVGREHRPFARHPYAQNEHKRRGRR